MIYNFQKSRIAAAIVSVVLICTSVNASTFPAVADPAGQGEQLTVSITGQRASFRIEQASEVVGHWQFNEGSGDSIHDISGYNIYLRPRRQG